MFQVAPLISSRAIPYLARVGFALFVGSLILPLVLSRNIAVPDNLVEYFLLVTGEALIGLIIGFYLLLIFSVFQLAGQFFSLQMGFGASQVFDPMAQIQLPLMGQFLNIVAMFVFITMKGFYKFVYIGVSRSFSSIMAADLVAGRGVAFDIFLRGLGYLFENALMISFPILGTLFLVSVTTGLLAKAAPQMNLLMMGFPIAIGTAFLILIVCIPFLMQVFSRFLDNSFENLMRFLTRVQEAGV
jgi:flagellar biosynthetic protein FliR